MGLISCELQLLENSMINIQQVAGRELPQIAQIFHKTIYTIATTTTTIINNNRYAGPWTCRR